MTVHHENDVIHLRKSVSADVIGEKRSLVIPQEQPGQSSLFTEIRCNLWPMKLSSIFQTKIAMRLQR